MRQKDTRSTPISCTPHHLRPEESRPIQQLRQGDLEAGYRFVHDYYPDVYRYLLYLTGRAELAGARVQETFLQARQGTAGFAGRASLPVSSLHQTQTGRTRSSCGASSESYPQSSRSVVLHHLHGYDRAVEYTVPGWFEWHPPGPDWLRWVIPIVPGREGRRTLMPPVLERTRAAALEAARRLFPTIRDRLLRALQRGEAAIDAAEIAPQETQIVPTELNLTMVHIPGDANRRQLHMVTAAHGMGVWNTW